jgi:crotonobetainyl-CoA:carnitine CoA-transferase CaiB-like acyl-CoA transferase
VDGIVDAVGAQGPLSGVRVVDLTTTFMGPYCTMQLARMGADVVKVEEPTGDVTRGINDASANGLGPIFLNANHGKRSVALNLKDPRGRSAFLELARTADVVVHNMRQKAVEKLRITAEDIRGVNPTCVYVSLTGFGEGGPYEDLAAYDDVIQAVSGLAFTQAEGDQPVYVKSAIADKTVGLIAVGAILAALYDRLRTGRGHVVAVPMFESMVSFNLLEHQGGLVFDPPQGPTGYSRLSSPYRRPYRTADGYLGVVVYTDRMWASFFDLVGASALAEDPRFLTITGRTEHIDDLYRLVECELAKQPSAYWQHELASRGIPVVPVRTAEELFNDPHLAAVEMFQAVEHPVAGRLRMSRHPVRFDENPEPATEPAPLLGQHSTQLLQAAGISPDDIDTLVRDGVVRTASAPAKQTQEV